MWVDKIFGHEQMTMHKIKVELGERSYSVMVGHGVINQLDAMLPKSAKRAVVVTQSQIGLQPELKIDSTTVVIGGGEEKQESANNRDARTEVCRVWFD